MNTTRLRELRGDKTQADVCEELGITRVSYSNYERGREMPYPVLIKVADYYNVSLDYLLGRSGSLKPYRPVPLTKTQKNLLGMYALMDSGQQLQFYGFAVGLLSASGKDVSPFII